MAVGGAQMVISDYQTVLSEEKINKNRRMLKDGEVTESNSR